MTREDIEGRDQETDDDGREINPVDASGPVRMLKSNRIVSPVRPLSSRLPPFGRQSNGGQNAEFQPPGGNNTQD